MNNKWGFIPSHYSSAANTDEILSLGDDREIIPVLIRYDKYPDDVSEEFYAPRVSDGEITIGAFYSLPDNSYDYGVAMPYYYTATP